jgi:predicted amidohydrolase YtcJ
MDRRRFLGIAALGSAGAVLHPTQVTIGAIARRATVFVGGPIISMTRRGRLSALAVAGNRIVAVNEAARLLLALGARRIDLRGRALFPGFVDAHSHWYGDFALAAQGNPAWSDITSGEDAVRRAVESGWTTITEHFANQERIDGLAALDGDGRLPLRVNCYMPVNFGTERFGDWYLAHPQDEQVSPRVRIAGVKFFADGGGTWYLREPYETCRYPSGDNLGEFFWEPAELVQAMGDAHRAGYQLTVHCMGDGAADILLDTMAAIDPLHANPMRSNLTHLVVLHDDQLARLRDQRVVASVQLDWFAADEADRIECWFGPGRLGLIGRWRDLLGAGVRTCGSTDFPYGQPVIGTVLQTLYTATTRIGSSGALPPAWAADQRLTTRQAVRLLTRASAWAMREEADKGALVPGMLADLVVFSDDPLAVEPTALLDLEVAATIVNGSTAYAAAAHADLTI